MILSNVELHRALDCGRLVIRPEPRPRAPDRADPRQYCPYDTHSVDLSLGDEIVIPEPGTYSFDLSQGEPLGPFLARNSRRVLIQAETVFPLKPHQFVLAKTQEYVSLPVEHPANAETCLAARIEGKSSRARVGLLIHFTAPTVHPGFKGTLTLEMINLGPTSILLRPGMPIAQLIVEEVKGIPRPNPSQFQGQTSPEGTAS
jgi:dCTP deaminase